MLCDGNRPSVQIFSEQIGYRAVDICRYIQLAGNRILNRLPNKICISIAVRIKLRQHRFSILHGNQTFIKFLFRNILVVRERITCLVISVCFTAAKMRRVHKCQLFSIEQRFYLVIAFRLYFYNPRIYCPIQG